MKRMTPYGSANFEEIAAGDYFYVDKTRYIEKLERVKFPVFLRPRRFGKSLHTEMLRCYYDLRMKDRFEALFGKLHAGRNPTGQQNSYFFLSLDFSGMLAYAAMDELELRQSFDRHVAGALFRFLLDYRDHLGLDIDSARAQKEKYEQDASAALADLCGMVAGLGGRLYVAIDEYDSLTNALALRHRSAAPGENLYLRSLGRGGFFRNFFEALKSGVKSAIAQIYMTGILPITISDMNSGFNIASWIQLEEEFGEMLGITPPELDALLDEVYADYPSITLGRQEVKATLKEYYNGYRFTQRAQEVYNPMMTLYFLKSVIGHNRFPDLLADSNLRIGYDQIAFLLGRDAGEAGRVITEITDTRGCEIFSHLQVSFDMEDFREGRHIAEGLFFTGILTLSESMNRLVVPNLVTYGFAIEYFNRVRGFEYSNGQYARWIGAYKRKGDAEALVRGFFDDVIRVYPGQFFSNVNESFYHGLFFHVLHNHTEKDLYEVVPEFNLPTGRADLLLRTYPGQSQAPARLNDIFELKRVPSGASQAQFRAACAECRGQAAAHKVGPYAGWRAVAVCFRGNEEVWVETL